MSSGTDASDDGKLELVLASLVETKVIRTDLVSTKVVLTEEEAKEKELRDFSKLLDRQDVIQLVLFVELPKISRTSRKLCQICRVQNVWSASFTKCATCTSGEDASRSWTEFKTNADYQSAHVSKDAIIYGRHRLQMRVCFRQVLTETQRLLPPLVLLTMEYI